MTFGSARRKLLARLRRRKSREKEGLFLVEGIRSASEALAAGADVAFALLSPRADALSGGEGLARALERVGVELHRLEDAELQALSDTEHPQGVVLVCREPARSLDDLAARGGETPAPAPGVRLLVLDGIQDPGNAGTLVRAAAAFGLSGVLALDGTVDPYGAKAVRASAGGIFRVPVARAPWERVGPWLHGLGVRGLVADPSGADVARADPSPPWALVVGSEASGPRPEVAAACDEVVGVPMPGGSESLNAAMAGSILLYVLTRESEVG